MFFLIWPFCLILLDRLTKYAALHWLPDGGFVYRWGGLVAIKNHGISFSVPVPNFLLWIILTLALILICGWLKMHWKSGNIRQIAGMTILLTGALSNIADRIIYGGVVDIFYLPVWATFNIADVGIVVGAGMVVWRRRRNRIMN